MNNEVVKVIATNRKARFEYSIEDTIEAGLVLTGSEIKSIRSGQVSLQESFVATDDRELWVMGMHIATYNPGQGEPHEPLRPRKLLLHRSEISKWSTRVRQRGYTIVPMRLYIKGGKAKLEIGIGKGKKLYDKRQSIAQRDNQRHLNRVMSDHRRGRP